VVEDEAVEVVLIVTAATLTAIHTAAIAGLIHIHLVTMIAIVVARRSV